MLCDESRTFGVLIEWDTYTERAECSEHADVASDFEQQVDEPVELTSCYINTNILGAAQCYG